MDAQLRAEKNRGAERQFNVICTACGVAGLPGSGHLDASGIRAFVTIITAHGSHDCHHAGLDRAASVAD